MVGGNLAPLMVDTPRSTRGAILPPSIAIVGPMWGLLRELR